MSAVSSPTKMTVRVVYNGVEREIAYQPHQQVTALLQHAVQAFSIAVNAHLMSLFNETGQELPDGTSVQAAGVHPGDRLILRQSSVKGGAA